MRGRGRNRPTGRATANSNLAQATTSQTARHT
nr:MAG TPA: hypothetical protein [Caudoviricetes sp.]